MFTNYEIVLNSIELFSFYHSYIFHEFLSCLRKCDIHFIKPMSWKFNSYKKMQAFWRADYIRQIPLQKRKITEWCYQRTSKRVQVVFGPTQNCFLRKWNGTFCIFFHFVVWRIAQKLRNYMEDWNGDGFFTLNCFFMTYDLSTLSL